MTEEKQSQELACVSARLDLLPQAEPSGCSNTGSCDEEALQEVAKFIVLETMNQ